RAQALRHDAFESHLARMGEDGRAVALDVLVEAQAKASFGQHTSKRGLADLKRIAPQVVAVQLNEVEGVQKHANVSAAVTDEIERGNAIVIASDSFTVDNAGVRAQAGQCLDGKRRVRSLPRRLYSLTCAPFLRAIDAEAVVLDLVQPL